ncbi:piggyBac transposable element-derived protein 4-like [Cydia fagiglandana]|uniref:piggyBac transposable element-derived protein 4-like n=1 Tax=Cydia fagiglandana TaxID=1458189 RepID=UPI002FEDED07
MRDNEIENVLFYGSDADDSEDDEDEERFPIVLPRVSRVYLSDVDSDDEIESSTTVEYSWPPPNPVPATSVVEPTEPAPAPIIEPTEQPTTAADCPAPYPAKFRFEWRQFPQPQVSPNLRRESFSQANRRTALYTNPYEAFVAIWDRSIIEHVANETNKYAQQLAAAMLLQGIAPNSRITRWVDTTVDELYTYFALILAMGIVVKSRLDEYWNTTKDIFCTPEFSTNMSIDRFLLLSKCLHFNDNATCTADRLSNDEAKLHKLLPIVQHLNMKFSSLYTLGQNIALDESLTQWKGWLNIKNHIPNKAAQVGIKTYEICESQTGYLWRFEVEAKQGVTNQNEQDPISGKIPTLVLKLLRGLEHNGHTVWMDNYYNSPALARELKLLGFDCVGTLRTNRQFVPVELTNLTNRDMNVGQVCGCTSGDVDLIVWRDKKRIALISTYHGLTTLECGGIVKPALIHDYNICMGGVDKKDQMLAMYPIERTRTKVWYKFFFKRLLNASTLNAFIMLKQNDPLMTHRNFRKNLVIQLLQRHKPVSPRPPAILTTPGRHMPKYFEKVLQQAGYTRHRRRKCVVCRKPTISYCEGCDGKALCVSSCFSLYHP